MTDYPRFYAQNTPSSASQPAPGSEMWRLQNGPHLQTCELRSHRRAGARWDVAILVDGIVLFSRHCRTEKRARLLAESFKQDALRTGWTA